MKKSLIAGAGVAALGFAAMPVLGVFAVTSSVTDQITVTIPSSCAIVSSTTGGAVGDGTTTTNTYTAQMQNKQLKSDIGATGAGTSGSNVLSVACNDSSASSTWKLTAVGGDGTTASTVMKAAGSGTDIVTGTATSGAISNWAMKVTGATGVTIQNGFDAAAFKAVPGSATVVAEGTGSVSNAFTMTYQVWISETQEADSYTGKVTYTLTSPNA